MAATVKAGAKSRANGTSPKEPEPFRFSSETEPEPEERVPFFYVDGQEFTILVNPGMDIGTDALDMMAEGGPTAIAAAERYVMESMIGKDGWAALRKLKRDRKIPDAQFRAVITEVRTRAMGPMEDAAPN